MVTLDPRFNRSLGFGVGSHNSKQILGLINDFETLVKMCYLHDLKILIKIYFYSTNDWRNTVTIFFFKL